MSYGPTEPRLVGGVHELLERKKRVVVSFWWQVQTQEPRPSHLLQRDAKSEVRLDTPAADVLRWESC